MKSNKKMWLALTALALPYLCWLSNTILTIDSEMKLATAQLKQAEERLSWIRSTPDSQIWKVLDHEKRG